VLARARRLAREDAAERCGRARAGAEPGRATPAIPSPLEIVLAEHPALAPSVVMAGELARSPPAGELAPRGGPRGGGGRERRLRRENARLRELLGVAAGRIEALVERR
jgi:hypothetical protein